MKILKNRVFWYYFFLLAGGIWNFTGLFQGIMSTTSGYVMILLGIITLLETRLNFKIILYSIFVIISSILLEYLGVRTGLIFGNYHYTDILQPQVLNVPLAIGFSWMSLTLISIRLSLKSNRFIKIVSGASILTLIDFIIEPAAIKLNYWTWAGGTPPLLNYISWFGAGLLFMMIADFLNLKIKGKNLIHILFAQIIFFILSQI